MLRRSWFSPLLSGEFVARNDHGVHAGVRRVGVDVWEVRFLEFSPHRERRTGHGIPVLVEVLDLDECVALPNERLQGAMLPRHDVAVLCRDGRVRPGRGTAEFDLLAHATWARLRAGGG